LLYVGGVYDVRHVWEPGLVPAPRGAGAPGWRGQDATLRRCPAGGRRGPWPRCVHAPPPVPTHHHDEVLGQVCTQLLKHFQYHAVLVCMILDTSVTQHYQLEECCTEIVCYPHIHIPRLCNTCRNHFSKHVFGDFLGNSYIQNVF